MDVFDEIAPDVDSSQQDVFDLAEQNPQPVSVTPPVSAPAFVPRTGVDSPAFVPTKEDFTIADEEGGKKGRLRSAVSAVMQGGAVGSAQTISGLARLGDMLAAGTLAEAAGQNPGSKESKEMLAAARRLANRTPSQREKDIAENPVYAFGKELAAGAKEAFPTNPKYKGEFFTDVLPSSAGQLVPTVAAGMVNPVLAAGQYGLSSGQAGAEESIAAGDLEDADKVYLAYLGIGGLSELALGVPAHVLRYLRAARLGNVSKKVAAETAKKLILKGSLREAGQESLEQVGQNVVAQKTFDPKRPTLQGVPESAAAGFLLGGAVSAGAVGTAKLANEIELRRENDVFDQAIEQSANKIAAMGTMPQMAQRGVRQMPSGETPEGAITSGTGGRVQQAIRQRQSALSGKQSEAEEVAKEIGATFKPVSAVKMQGIPTEMAAQLEIERKKNGWEFTPQPGSPIEGQTFYVPEGASRETILKRYQEKVKENEAVAPTTINPPEIDSSLIVRPIFEKALTEGKEVNGGEAEKLGLKLPDTHTARVDAQGVTWWSPKPDAPEALKGGDSNGKEKVQGQGQVVQPAAASPEAAVTLPKPASNRGQTLKVQNPYGLAPENEKILTVKGDIIKLRAAPALDFFVYRSGKNWRVVEKNSGQGLGDTIGRTRAEAIAKAEANVKKVGAKQMAKYVAEATWMNAEKPAAKPPASKRKGDLQSQGKRGWDLIDEAESNIGKISWKLIKEANPNWFPVGAARKIFAAEGTPADTAAKTLWESGHYKGDPGQVDQFGDAMNEAATARKGNRQNQAKESRLLDEADRQLTDFEEDATKQTKKTEPVLVDELQVGDKFTLNGHELKVTDLTFDEDGRIESITFDDGKKYGTQQVNDQTMLGALRQDKGSLVKAEASDPLSDFPEPEAEYPKYPKMDSTRDKGKDIFKAFHDGVEAWKTKVRAWLAEQPEKKAIVWEEVSTEYNGKTIKGNLKALTRNVGSRPWRVTTYWQRENGKLMSSGHQEYGTREEAMFEEGRSIGQFHERLPAEVMTEQEVQGYQTMADVADKATLVWYQLPEGETIGRFRERLRNNQMMQGFVVDSLTDGKVAFTKELPENWAENFGIKKVELAKPAAPAYVEPKFKEGDKVMVGEYPMTREGTIAAFGPYKDGEQWYFVNTNLAREQPFREADLKPVEAKPAAEQTPEQIYDASLEAFREASRAFTAIQKAYRAKEIGDAEFLAGRKAFDEATAVSDAAEAKFIAEKNKKTEPKPAAKFTGFHGTPKRVQFIAGEYAGMTGTLESEVQKRYTKEASQYRVQIDGFPKVGGWHGKVTVGAEVLADASAESPKPAAKPLPKFPIAIAKRMLALSHERQTDAFGPSNESLRQDIIEAVHGKRPPKSKAGSNAVKVALANLFGIDSKSMAGVRVDDAIRAELQRIVAGEETPAWRKLHDEDLISGRQATTLRAMEADTASIEQKKRFDSDSQPTTVVTLKNGEKKWILEDGTAAPIPSWWNDKPAETIEREPDQLERFSGIVKLASDTPNKLRASDVDRVMSEANKRPEELEAFREWLLNKALQDETIAEVANWKPEPVKQEAKFKQGDDILYIPKDRKQSEVAGIIVDVIHNQDGEVGYNVLSPLPGDPGRQIRIWAKNAQAIAIATGKSSDLPEGVTVTRDKDFVTSGNYTVTDGKNTDKIFRDPENKWWYSMADFDAASKTAFPATPLSTENRTEAIQKLLERWKAAEKPAAQPKPAEQSKLSPKQLKRLSELVKKQRAADEGGAALTPEENKELSELRSVGQADLLAEPEGSNEAAQRKEIARLRDKADELVRQYGFSMKRYRESKVQEVAAKHRDDANKLAQEAAAVRAEADQMERVLRGEKPPKPPEQGGFDLSPAGWDEVVSEPRPSAIISAPLTEKAMREMVNDPRTGVPEDMVRYINALIDSGLTHQIPGLRWAINDLIRGGAKGEYNPNSRLASFSRFAASTTPIHEFFHDVWYFLKPEDQAAIRKLREETIKSELGKARNYAEVSALEKMLADEVTSDDFINSKYPHEIYHLSNEREFFTWLMTDKAANQFDAKPEAKTFIGRIKDVLQKLWTAIKDAVGLSPKADALWRKILSGKYGFTPEEGREQEARELSRPEPLKQAVKMAAIDPANAERNVKAAQAGAEPVLGFMVREVQRLEAIAAQEATTPAEKLRKAIAEKTLRNRDFYRAIRRKVEGFLSSKQYTDDAITTYDEAKAGLDVPNATQEQRDKMSNIAGNAVNELVDIENKRTEFNENYESKRRELVSKIESSAESEMEAFERVEATETILTDFRQMALPILRQSNDASALQAYTYAMGRTEAVRRVLDFIGHEVDLTGARTAADVERLIREAAGRTRIQEHVESVVGATRDVIQAVARIVALVEPIRERLTEARYLYGQQAGTRSTALKTRLEGLVRAGNYARALEVFGRGSEKVGAQHDRAVRELNFYARRTRSALIALRALDETKASLDNIWNDPNFQSKRTEIFNRQGVASVTSDLNGTTLILNAFPGQPKLKLVFGNNVSSEKSTLEQIREYKQNALAYIAGENPDPSIANGLKTTLPLLEQFLNASFAPEAARLLPNWLLKGFGSFMSRVGSIERIPYYLLQGTGGAWRAIADASLRARRDMGEQLQRIHSEHFPKLGLKLHAALQAHGGITPDTYFDRVWNHLAASRQNFRDVRYLSEGDPIGNGEKVTKEDLAYLEAYRKFHADLHNTTTNNGKRHFSSFRSVLTGIFFDNNGRVRMPFAHGVDMVNRRAPSNTEIGNWLKAWAEAEKSESKNEDKKAFLDSQLNKLVIGYMHGVNQADWVSKFKYSYENQVREVLAESGEQPIDSFDTLVDRVFEKAITEEGEVAPPTREDVENDLLSDFDSIFKRLSRYDPTEKKTDPKTGVEIVLSETEFNTERGNVIMPPNWYDYGGVTEGQWSSVSRASMFPYERAHLAAMQGLQSAIAEIVRDFKAQATSPSGRGLSAKGYFATRKQSRKARERGELIYSWADAEDLLRKVTHYTGKLRAMAESPMLLTEMDRPNVILQKGGIQVVVSALLLRIPAMARNLLGGYTNAVLDDMAFRGRSSYIAIPARAAEVVADVYKNVLALLAHDGNPAGRSLHKLLSEASSWNIIGPVAENFLKAVNEQRELYRDAAELGLNLNVAFWDSLSVLRKFSKSGGSVREPGNPVAQLLGKIPTVLRMGGLIMGQAGVGKVDSWINSKAYVQARQYEQVYKRMARKYGEQVAALGLKQFPPKAFGGEHQALRARDFFSRMAGLDIDAEMAKYYQRWSEAKAREQSEGVTEGTHSDAVDLLNDEQRNTLSVASADSFNLATFANRPYSTKSSNTASILGLFYGYVDWWLHKLLSLANTNSRKGMVAGHLENLPFLLFAGLAFALVAMMKDDAIKWLKEYLLNQQGAYPKITDSKTAPAAARAAAGALAADFPVVGGMASKAFDLGYSGGSNPYDLILALGMAKNFVDAGVETFKTGDATIPAMRLADRYFSPVPLHKLTDKMSGSRAMINTGNILESEARAQNDEENLKPRAAGFNQDFTPATPLITKSMNAIGNGDMDEFQKHYTALVEEYRKQGKSDPERNAKQSLMTRNPVSVRFAKRPSDAEFQKYLAGMTPIERKIVEGTLQNYRQAMNLIGSDPSFTAEEAAGSSKSTPASSGSALPASALPRSSGTSRGSTGGTRVRSGFGSVRPRRVRGVRTRLTLGRRRKPARIRIRRSKGMFSPAIRKPRRIRIRPRPQYV